MKLIASAPSSRAIFLATLCFHVLGIALVMAAAPFPSAFDELQHLSFVRWSELHPDLFPHYEAMRVLTPDLRRWAGETWLYHPSPYYLALTGLDRISGSILALRVANAVLSLGAVAALLLIGFRELRGDAERAVYAATLVAFPKLAVVGGMINNDNLALAVAAMGLLALIRWRDNPSDATIALALAAAGWTKLTVLLMVAFALGFLALQMRRRGLRPYAWALVGGTVGALPNLVNLARYGAPLWHGMAQFTPPAQRVPLDLTGYAALFVREMVQSWAALEPSNAMSLLGAAIVLAAGVLFCATRWRREPVPIALMLATIPALLLHFWFGWQAYLRDGFLHEAQTRYYYVVWPGFALAAAILWRDWRARAQTARTTLTATTAVLLLTGTAVFCVPLALMAGKVH